jgi:hypothetical protein
MHHVPLLEKARVSKEGIETGRTVVSGYLGKDGEKTLGASHCAVLNFVHYMTKNIKVSDDAFEVVRKPLNERQIVELGKFSLSLSLSLVPYYHEESQS